VPFYIEYDSQNPLLQDKFVCNERPDGLLNGCFRARGGEKCGLEMPIPKIPVCILKNVEFHNGKMSSSSFEQHLKIISPHC
jgi:hypothetical protein